MKKRLISILLTLLMVMSMFTGMSVSAYADDDMDDLYVEYKLAQGDYVLRICQRLGINYYTCKEAIMALNNITSENGFRYLSVGEVVKIPVSDAAAIAIMTGEKPSSTGTTTGGTASGTVSSGATIAYYLIPYTMQRGETVLGVCNSLGISFANYADQIMEINGISSWNKVGAGTTLLLPSTKTPAVGTTCYAVVAHKVASGDTAYTLCQKYGVSYGGSTKLLQALNNTENLAAIKAGKNFYLPVATTIKAASSTSTGSTSTNTNTNTNTNTSDSTSTNTAAKSYDISANINTSYGSMAFYVNNKAVSEAKAGDTVTVVVTTNSKKAIDGLVVKYADGRADLNLTGNSFVMPACDVRVDAEIKSGYNITINSNYGYKTAATVEGVSVSSATEGSSVKIVSTDPSYEVKTISVYYTTLLGLKKEVTVNDGRYFMMPAKNVTVDVELAPVKTYNFYRADCENGGFDIQVDGSSVSKAAKGAKVTVVWEAVSGYDIGAIKVTNKSTGKNINVFNNSFTMPASDVIVEVTFVNNSNVIEIEAIEGGILCAYDKNGNVITEADTGAEVYLGVAKNDSGYDTTFDVTVKRNADGHLVTLGGANNNMFKMPAGGVTITGKLTGELVSTTLAYTPLNAGNNVYINDVLYDDDGMKAFKFAVGSTVELRPLSRDGFAFERFVVSTGNTEWDQDLTDMANEQGKIVVPSTTKLEITAEFVADAIEIGFAEIEGEGVVSYQVNGNTAHNCQVGDTVEIIAVATNPGFIVTEKNLTVINKQTDKELKVVDSDNDGYFEFKMPAEGVTISVSFVGEEHTVKMFTEPASLNGKSMWALYINGYEPNVENTTAGSMVKAHTGDALMLFQTDVSTEDYSIEKIEILGSNGKKYSGGLEYYQESGRYGIWMPDDDITITVYMKENTDRTVSLENVSWDTSKGSVGSTIGNYTNPVVSSAEVGDIISIVPKAQSPYYYVEEDSLSITRNSDGGAFTLGAAGDPVIDGKIIPVVTSGKVVAWQYKMPEGGITAHVKFVGVKNDITLNVVDTNGTSLKGLGYIAVSNVETDALYEVTNDIVTDVEYGYPIMIRMTTIGSELYELESVNVPGVEVNNFAFWMPETAVTVDVVLKEIVTEPETIKLRTVKGDYGTLQYFAEEACNNNLNGDVAVGADVFIRPVVNTGYRVTGISVKSGSSELAMTTGTPGVWKFIAPANDVEISVSYEKIVSKLTINVSADVNKLMVKIGKNAEQLITTAGQTTFEVEYGQKIQFYGAKGYTLEKMTIDGLTPANHEGSTIKVDMPERDLEVISFTIKANT